MSINRIDFQGAFLNTGEQNNVKSADNSKVQGQQAAFQTQFDKQKIEESRSVSETPDMFKQQSKFDAREKSKNEYERRKGNPKKEKDGNEEKKGAKDQKQAEGDIRRVGLTGGLRKQTHSFDFKI